MAFSSKAEVHAVESQITLTSRRHRGQGRTRPFLRQACQKTRLCKLYLQGACGRGADECSFAHGEEQIKVHPNLHCTKLCPMMQSTGECNRGSRCKFAHNSEELRGLGLSPDLRSVLPSAWQQTDTRVVSALNLAAAAGALSMGEMVMHLAKIFVLACEARPLRTTSEVPTELLAAVTAEQAWARLNLARSERLTFEDFLRLSLLPSRCAEIGSNVDFKRADGADGAMSEQSTVGSGDDSSPCSFECESPSSRSSSGSQTPSHQCSSPWDSPSAQDLLFVRNTFIEVRTAPDPEAQATRRARSSPPSRS